MSGLDPRAQIALFAAVLVATLAGGIGGLACGMAIAIGWTIVGRVRASALRPLLAVLPLAVFIVVLDAATGRATEGIAAALRLETTTALALAFARSIDARRIASGLRALGVPYSFVFVVIAGARFVPVAGEDLSELFIAVRLRGLAVGGMWQRVVIWRMLLVPMLVITIRRGMQLGEAMEARGFSAASRVTTRGELVWRGRDTFATIVALVLVAAILLLGSGAA